MLAEQCKASERHEQDGNVKEPFPFEWEERCFEKAIDSLNSITEKSNSTAPWLPDMKRVSLRMKGLQIREKAHNLAKDAVSKITNFLATNFQFVHASHFEVSGMSLCVDDTATNTAPKRRLIRKQTVRDLQGWLHYPFKETLKHKMERIDGLVVEFASEAHTAKMRDSCGVEKENVGGVKFTCDSCRHSRRSWCEKPRIA